LSSKCNQELLVQSDAISNSLPSKCCLPPSLEPTTLSPRRKEVARRDCLLSLLLSTPKPPHLGHRALHGRLATTNTLCVVTVQVGAECVPQAGVPRPTPHRPLAHEVEGNWPNAGLVAGYSFPILLIVLSFHTSNQTSKIHMNL
jgi:hypothetical protein